MRASGLVYLLLLAACGDIKTASDGGPGDDGGTPDARAVGSVTVTIGKLFDVNPLAGNQVVVVDSAGAIAADLTTDEGGVATADDVEAGSTMIILVAAPPAGSAAGQQAIVIAGIEPGDDIHLDREGYSGPGAGTMTVTWPTDGADHYLLSTGCRDGSSMGTSTDMTFDDDCLVSGEAEVMIRAVDTANATLGWLGGTVAFSTPGTFDVAGPWSTPRMLDVTLSDIPSEAVRVRPGVLPLRGGLPFVAASEPQVDLLEDTVVVHPAVPTIFADAALVTLDFEPDQPTLGGNSLATWVERDVPSLDLSLAGELLPWYGFPVLDLPARTVSWTRTTGHEPDAQYLLMFWSEKGAPAGEEWMTVMMLPPGATELTLPALPEAYEQFLPVNPEDVHIQIQAAESTEVDGYRAARQSGFSLIYNRPTVGLEGTSTLRRAFAGEDF